MVSADVSVVSVKDAVEEAVRTNGHVDVLVNCAGITHPALLQDTSPEKFEVCSVHMRYRMCVGIKQMQLLNAHIHLLNTHGFTNWITTHGHLPINCPKKIYKM